MKDNIINLNEYRDDMHIQKIKDDLCIEIQKLEDAGVDMRQKYVIFDTSDVAQHEVTKEDIVANLHFCATVLTSLGEELAVNDVNNIIARLKNNYYQR